MYVEWLDQPPILEDPMQRCPAVPPSDFDVEPTVDDAAMLDCPDPSPEEQADGAPTR